MKVKITQRGVYDKDNNELEVGSVLNLGSDVTDVPLFLKNKCEVLGAKPKEAEAVTNVDPDADKAAADKAAADKDK